jgi:hypothetical protein
MQIHSVPGIGIRGDASDFHSWTSDDFKISPAFMRKTIFRLHTSPIVLIAIFSILMIGHSMVD